MDRLSMEILGPVGVQYEFVEAKRKKRKGKLIRNIAITVVGIMGALLMVYLSDTFTSQHYAFAMIVGLVVLIVWYRFFEAYFTAPDRRYGR